MGKDIINFLKLCALRTITKIGGGDRGIVIPTNFVRGPLSLRALCALVPNPATNNGCGCFVHTQVSLA